MCLDAAITLRVVKQIVTLLFVVSTSQSAVTRLEWLQWDEKAEKFLRNVTNAGPGWPPGRSRASKLVINPGLSRNPLSSRNYFVESGLLPNTRLNRMIFSLRH